MKSYEVPQCAICFDELTVDLAVTKCGHVYHKKCIQASIDINGQCPLDRVENTQSDIKGIAYSIILRDDAEIEKMLR